MSTESHAHDAHEEHIVPYSTYFLVFGGLLLLTSLTVAAAYLDEFFGTNTSGVISTSIAMGIASVKATLVLLFFMHLYYDKPIFRWMFITLFVTYVIYFVLTLADTVFRY